MNERINSAKAPVAAGPYSQAIKAGDLLFCSGMLPVDPETNELVENDVVIQSRQIFKNLEGLLTDAGYSVEDVVKTTCFLTDMKDFAAFNEVYSGFFTSKPARSCFAVKELPKGALVEVELIASK